MNTKYIQDQKIEKSDDIVQADYEKCTFFNCNLSKTNLSDFSFIDCVFENCDLTLSKIDNTGFKKVKFINCKLLGLHFEHCNPFLLSLSFENCNLNFCSFYQLNLKNIKFINCSIQEAEFTEADLYSCTFENCDLYKSAFQQVNLENSDLRTAYNYSIDPEFNRIKGAKFSIQELKGLLTKYNIKVEE